MPWYLMNWPLPSEVKVRSLIISLISARILSQLFTMYLFFSANHFAALHQWDHEPHRGSSMQLSAGVYTSDARKHAHALELWVRFPSDYYCMRLISILLHRHGENRCSAINISPLRPLRGGWQNPSYRLQATRQRHRCWHWLERCHFSQ